MSRIDDAELSRIVERIQYAKDTGGYLSLGQRQGHRITIDLIDARNEIRRIREALETVKRIQFPHNDCEEWCDNYVLGESCDCGYDAVIKALG